MHLDMRYGTHKDHHDKGKNEGSIGGLSLKAQAAAKSIIVDMILRPMENVLSETLKI